MLARSRVAAVIVKHDAPGQDAGLFVLSLSLSDVTPFSLQPRNRIAVYRRDYAHTRERRRAVPTFAIP